MAYLAGLLRACPKGKAKRLRAHACIAGLMATEEGHSTTNAAKADGGAQEALHHEKAAIAALLARELTARACEHGPTVTAGKQQQGVRPTTDDATAVLSPIFRAVAPARPPSRLSSPP